MPAFLVFRWICRCVAPLAQKALTVHCQNHGPASPVGIYRLNYLDLIQAQDEQDCSSRDCRKGGEHAGLEALFLLQKNRQRDGIKLFFLAARLAHGRTEGSIQSTASTYRKLLHQPWTKSDEPLMKLIPCLV